MKSTKRSNDPNTSSGSGSGTQKITSSTNSTTTTTSNKRTKRWPLHVEAVIHPYCPFAFQNLEIEIEKFVKSVGQSSFMYKEGILDLSKASETIQKSCLQIAIVDIPSTTNNETLAVRNDQDNNDTIEASKSNTKNNNDQKLLQPQVPMTAKTVLMTSATTRNRHNIIQSQSSITSWSISKIVIHCYVLSNESPEPEEIDEINDEPITVCEVLPVPHQSLHTSWENLIYPKEIKENIIGYAESSLLFSNKGVSNHLISWNRVLLLHGPPGTGKTSLCRALAQKLTIRTNHIFPSGGYLLEVKSHSLFSKWFSESGKLISKLFERIREMVEDEPKALFCVLIDEVESLASSRVGGGNGNGGGAAEPSDAVRAVNSVLTSLDSIRSFQNVLVLTTTNITDSIDSAFVDRVDLKQYIGHPCLEARYEILRSCILELIKVGILSRDDTTTEGISTFTIRPFIDIFEETVSSPSVANQNPERLLLDCARAAENMSGRSLRKLPFQTHAFFIRTSESTPIKHFLGSLMDGIAKEKSSKGELSQT